jgi:2-methylcitrate dehydratase PrpD
MNPKMNAASRATISARLADYAAGLRYEDLPTDVRELAHLVLLDTLGCALAGSTTDEVIKIRQAMTAANAGAGDTILWGTSEKLPLPFAVLVNGAAVHAREMDDFGGCAHSGSVVIPAALGTAAREGACGRELLTAIVVGYDIAKRVMDGGGGYLAFKEVGWHSTSTCGGFGAAVAAGRLLGLDAKRLQWAIGYAGSNAGGTWAFIPEGAMSKRVHPGFASQTGVISAYLAASDVTAPESIFEAEWGGYYPTYVPGKATPERATEDLGTDFRIRQVGCKPYAACRGIHSSIDAVLAMRNTHHVKPSDVVKVIVRGSRTHVKQLGKQAVQTALDAQMSLPYSIAVALETGGAMLDQYSAEALGRSSVLTLAQRVTVVHEPSVPDGAEPYVDIELKNGERLSERVMVARGDHANPLSEAEIVSKFRVTAGQAFDAAHVARIEKAVREIAKSDNVRTLDELMRPTLAKAQKLPASIT